MSPILPGVKPARKEFRSPWRGDFRRLSLERDLSRRFKRLARLRPKIFGFFQWGAVSLGHFLSLGAILSHNFWAFTSRPFPKIGVALAPAPLRRSPTGGLGTVNRWRAPGKTRPQGRWNLKVIEARRASPLARRRVWGGAKGREGRLTLIVYARREGHKARGTTAAPTRDIGPL
jgi:hypothetical protein